MGSGGRGFGAEGWTGSEMRLGDCTVSPDADLARI